MMVPLAMVIAFGASLASGQIFSLTLSVPAKPGATPGPRPVSGTTYAINLQALTDDLRDAPSERPDGRLSEYGRPLWLPGPDGALTACFVAESPVMEPELAAKYPGIKSYIVQSADLASAGRIELSQRGLTGMIRSPEGTWMIDPWQSADPGHAVAYFMRDLPGGGDWECGTRVDDPHNGPLPENQSWYVPRVNQTLRTYRTAVACTGEYGLHHCTLAGNPPNTADPLAAIVTVVARTNVVYEADMAIRFVLISSNDRLIYTNPATDPYSSPCDGGGGTDCSSSYLAQNASNLSSVIGNSNFDIGHLMTRVFGGVANLRCICTSSKARGISGIPRGGDVDPLSALVVIHEIGHQFGANHTFSGTRGRCQGNVNLNTAWEAGSGSSPMAYAGGCPVGDAPPSDNIVQFADPYFHHGSYLEMRAFIAGTGGNCPTSTATANAIPEITFITPDTAIPPGTPFTLTASASDGNGDPLTFSWEQFDSGAARPLSGDGAEDNGIGSLFRVFPPVAASSRTFPRMADVLSGVPTPGERLPTVTDVERRFRVYVRDNAPGAGGMAVSDFVDLFIPPEATPFTVTSPGAGSVLHPGPAEIAWSVGGTHLPPISCTQVVIGLSLDDGQTFPFALGTFANSGTASVVLPEAVTSVARIRVDPVGGIFFSISSPFSLQPRCLADFNQDGGVDGTDVEAFFAVWTEGLDGADLNEDGGVDGADVEFFFTRWEAGC